MILQPSRKIQPGWIHDPQRTLPISMFSIQVSSVLLFPLVRLLFLMLLFMLKNSSVTTIFFYSIHKSKYRLTKNKRKVGGKKLVPHHQFRTVWKNSWKKCMANKFKKVCILLVFLWRFRWLKDAYLLINFLWILNKT